MRAPKSYLPIVFSGFALTLPPIALVASKGVVVLLLATAVLAALAAWRGGLRLSAPDPAVTLSLGALLLWCAVSSLWSFEVLDSLVLVLRIAVIFGAGLVLWAIAGTLDDRARTRIGWYFLAGLIATLAIMVADTALGHPLFRYLKLDDKTRELYQYTDKNLRYMLNRGATAVALFCWPATAFLWQRGFGRAAVALLVLVGAVLAFMTSMAAGAGMILGLLVLGIGSWSRTAGRAFLVLAMVAAVISGPLIGKVFFDRGWHKAEWLPSSSQHRVAIWKYALEWVDEEPVLGWGFDSSREIAKKLRITEDGTVLGIPLHPHNAGLQIMLELGVPGIVLALVLLWILAARLERLRGPPRICGQALFVATLTIASTAYGIWQNQWLALILSASLLIPLTFQASAQPKALREAAPGRPQPAD